MSQDTSTKRPKVKHHVANDQAFQICPEWVLMADISAQAIRLYLVLRKFGDNTTEESRWSRENIAAAMKLKSPRSVDQYIKELVGIGALKVTPRFDGDRQTSNLYKVITADPSHYVSREVAESCTPVGAESCSRTQNQNELRTTICYDDPAGSSSNPGATTGQTPSRNSPGPKRDKWGVLEGDRRKVREAIMKAAQEKYGTGVYYHLFEDFLTALAHYYGEDIAGYAENKWTIHPSAADPRGAGKELNTLISTAIAVEGLNPPRVA